MVKIIRRAMAIIFYKLGDLAADYKNNPIAPPVPQEPKEAKPKMIAGPVKFTDMTDYLKNISVDTDAGGFINICNKLKTMSFQKKNAVRLNFVKEVTYKPDGTQQAKDSTVTSGYHNHRWHKLQTFNLKGNQAVHILNEMAEAMAQAGWGCSNDGVHQMQQYLLNSSRENEKYLEERVELTQKDAKLKICISLVVNMTYNPRYDQPEPKLVIEITTCPPGSVVAVKSQHTVFFSQYAPIESEKNVA